MLSRRTAVLVSAIVLVFAMGGATMAFKHGHGLKFAVNDLPTVAPPGSVGGDIVFCPNGYSATGGGLEYNSGLPLISDSTVSSSQLGYEGIFIDNSGFGSAMTVRVVCVKDSTSKVRARPALLRQVRGQFEARLERLRSAQREAVNR
jgi:hypothetical protein